jgi:hypothetical protein
VKKCWKNNCNNKITYAVKIVRSDDEEIISTVKNTYLLGRRL